MSNDVNTKKNPWHKYKQMRLYVPCSVVAQRRQVLALRGDPYIQVLAFKHPITALKAAKVIAAGKWKLVVAGDHVFDMDPIASENTEVWETGPDGIAMAGLAGPSGVGVTLCDFNSKTSDITVYEAFTIEFEEVDYDSTRSRLEAELVL